MILFTPFLSFLYLSRGGIEIHMCFIHSHLFTFGINIFIAASLNEMILEQCVFKTRSFFSQWVIERVIASIKLMEIVKKK